MYSSDRHRFRSFFTTVTSRGVISKVIQAPSSKVGDVRRRNSVLRGRIDCLRKKHLNVKSDVWVPSLLGTLYIPGEDARVLIFFFFPFSSRVYENRSKTFIQRVTCKFLIWKETGLRHPPPRTSGTGLNDQLCCPRTQPLSPGVSTRGDVRDRGS